MHTFHTKLGQNGKLLLPVACRKMMNLSVNDDIVIIVQDGEANLFSLKHAIYRAQDIMKKYLKKGEKLSNDIILGRKKETPHQ